MASDEEQSGELSCLAHGFGIADYDWFDMRHDFQRTILEINITFHVVNHVWCFLCSRVDPWTKLLHFRHALFHALWVPAIHFEAIPSSVESISCVQRIEKDKGVLNYRQASKSKLSIHFHVILDRLCTLTFQSNEADGVGPKWWGRTIIAYLRIISLKTRSWDHSMTGYWKCSQIWILQNGCIVLL